MPGGTDEAKANALKVAAQSFYDAMIKGNTIGMSAYTTKECQDDFGMGMLGGEMFKQMFDTRLKVTKVKLEGDRGEILDGKVEVKVSDAPNVSSRRTPRRNDPSDVWQDQNCKW